MQKRPIKKYLLILAGSLSLILGVVGLALPVLPTTPFLILASFCYLRSSKRLYDWLIGNKLFGPYIYNYITHHAVAKKTKIIAMILLWASLLVSIFAVDIFHVRLLLLIVGLGVSIHIATLKTMIQPKHKNEDDLSNPNDRAGR